MYLRKNKKQLLLLLLLIAFVFTSFTLLHPMLKKTAIDDEEYTINTNKMNIRKRPPLFYQKDNGIFFIHPAIKANAKATFTFKESKKQLWHFSIQKGSPVGEILFIIKKNGDEIKKFTVNTKYDMKLDIDINKNDKITVVADPVGNTAGDWGNLEISNHEANYIFKLRIIPFLWVLFFIYLINKGYIQIAFNSYFGFLLTIVAEKVSYGSLEYAYISIYTAFFFLLAFMFMLIYQELRILKKLKIATLLSWLFTLIIYSIPISFIVFYLIFNKPVDHNILFAMYQTNPSEALGFIESFVSITYLLSITFFSLLLGYVFLHQEIKKRQLIERSLLMFIIILLVGFISSNIYKARIPKLIHNTFLDYNSQIKRLLAFQEKRKTSKIKYSATKKENGELYVVVIGESLNKHNMGIYGHFRKTTPRQSLWVEKDNLQVFENAYSNAGNTMQSLSLALTEANQYNNLDFLESLSFIDIFNKAGFDSTWISTQNVLGESNTIVSVIAQSSNHIIDLANSIKAKTGLSSYYDENTIEILRKRVSQNKNKNTLFIVHIYGNHFKYNDRYPEKYKKYKKSDPLIVGSNIEKILTNYSNYDNSVYYNDYVVSSLMNIVKKYDGVSTFLYFSDHGEDIIRHKGHTSREGSFTFPMTQIPLTAWMSPEYIKCYPDTNKIFTSHKDRLFSNDMIYDTILGLAHIKTDHYNAKYDLSSSKYHLDPKKAMTLHGKLKYNASNNYYFWRKYNTQNFKDNNLTNKIVISDTNTVGKLNEAWCLGYRSFKVNLTYNESNKHFQIASNKFDSESNILELFSYFETDKIKNLFLDLTNLNQSNIENIILRLEHINQKLKLKPKIVLVSNQFNLLKIFKEKGWKVALVDNILSKKTNIKDNDVDYLVLDTKTYKKIDNDNTLKNIIINHAFNLADNKLDGTQSMYDKKINFLFIDFTSEYDK